MEDCENCGCPLTAAPEAKRKTEFGELYRPEKATKRKTQIDGGSDWSAPSNQPQADYGNDPFAPAVTQEQDSDGQQGRAKKRHTIVEGGGSVRHSGGSRQLDPDDPFGAAVTYDPLEGAGTHESAPSGRQVLSPERPLAGLLITFSGVPSGRVFALTRGRTMVGRVSNSEATASIWIADDTVSEEHCVLVARESVVMVQDQMSSNGTKLKSHGDAEFRDILAEATVLKDGDLLKLGEVTLLVQLIDPARVREIWS